MLVALTAAMAHQLPLTIATIHVRELSQKHVPRVHLASETRTLGKEAEEMGH
jgi:hypothetical protein